ncbi:hypothetical protein [Rhizobium sp. BK176]|uniref:hypothetical protein n=1 Tax=Rhizobium sp. BK176 TaxID=2587071 RepID=UPI0021692931|nr:hypothetical protein [Rhizobium sp. BK176]MCS4090121.1 hypothetical protein [Rhizobium sp. BK176]
MTTKIILRQHAVIPRSLNMAALAIDPVTASATLGMSADDAAAVMADLSNASFENVQRLVATKGLTLTLVPAAMAQMVKEDRTPAGQTPKVQAEKAGKALPAIVSTFGQAASAARMAANDWAAYQSVGAPITVDTSLRALSEAAATARMALAIVSENSAYANCARVLPAMRGERKKSAHAKFFDGLARIATSEGADGFRSRPDLHLSALFDRMRNAGAAMRITLPGGEEYEAYTSEDIGAAVGILMSRIDRKRTAKELCLTLPMYDALETHPAGHRTTTLLGFLEKVGAKVSAVRSERKLGWATAEEVRPALLRA